MNKKFSIIFVFLAFVSSSTKGYCNDTVMFNRIIDLTIYHTTELAANYYPNPNASVSERMERIRKQGEVPKIYNEYPLVFSWDYTSLISPDSIYNGTLIDLGESFSKGIKPIDSLRAKCCSYDIIFNKIAPIPPNKSKIPFIQKIMEEEPLLYQLYRLELIYGVSQIKLELNNNKQQVKSAIKPISNNSKRSSLLWSVIGYGVLVISLIGVFWLVVLLIKYRRGIKNLEEELDEEKEKYIDLKNEMSPKITTISNQRELSIEKEELYKNKQEISPSIEPPALIQNDTKPIIILEEAYLPAPVEDGIFMVSNQRNSINFSESVFHIKQKNKNSNEYEFSIINDENIWVRALSYADVFLDPVCDIDFNSVEKGKRINVLQKGLLVKENGNYKTVQKIKIKIES